MNLWLPRWKRGDKPSASKLNATNDIVNSLRQITGDGNVSVLRTPTGTSLYSPEKPARVPWMWGVTATSLYTDARYNFHWAVPDIGADSVSLVSWRSSPPVDGSLDPDTAINLAEVVTGTHTISESAQPIQVYPMYDANNVRHWVFNMGGAGGQPKVFPCNLTQNGGGDPVDNTHNASWTYDLYNPDTAAQINTPGTPLAPVDAMRKLGFSTNPASHGLYRINGAGAVVLWVAYETINDTSCLP